MTACRECLLEAATIAEGLAEMFTGATSIGGHFRELARTAPSWNVEYANHMQRHMAPGDQVDVLLYQAPERSDWVRVRVARFWRAGFDWLGEGTAGRVTWNEEGSFWRRVRGRVVGREDTGGLVMSADLPGYESYDKTLPWGVTPATERALERLDREVAAFDTSIRAVGTRLVMGAPAPAATCETLLDPGPTIPCCRCGRPIRAHIKRLCVECWRAADRPEGLLEVVGEGATEPQP